MKPRATSEFTRHSSQAQSKWELTWGLQQAAHFVKSSTNPQTQRGASSSILVLSRGWVFGHGSQLETKSQKAQALQDSSTHCSSLVSTLQKTLQRLHNVVERAL